MSASEFDIIKQFFTFHSSRDDVLIAAGDDCASVCVPADKQLMLTTDTLISGVHFPENTCAEDIAYKAVMVNLSDLAAMGATPSWLSLAITLPEINKPWLQSFSTSLKQILRQYNIALIGGDTTKGVLSITIQAMGLCDKNKSMQRSMAKSGDKIFVTGFLGDAAIGLYSVLNRLNDVALESCVNRLNRPEARVDFAKELLAYSACAIDISDGLMADMGHIVKSSDCGAELRLTQIPISEAAKYYFKHYQKGVVDWSMLLTQGDDYELCFTLNKQHEKAVLALANKHQLNLSCIGEITKSKDLLCIDENNMAVNFPTNGFLHFSEKTPT